MVKSKKNMWIIGILVFVLLAGVFYFSSGELFQGRLQKFDKNPTCEEAPNDYIGNSQIISTLEYSISGVNSSKNKKIAEITLNTAGEAVDVKSISISGFSKDLLEDITLYNKKGKINKARSWWKGDVLIIGDFIVEKSTSDLIEIHAEINQNSNKSLKTTKKRITEIVAEGRDYGFCTELIAL